MYIFTSTVWGILLFYILANTCCCLFLNLGISIAYGGILEFLTGIYLMTNEVEQLFTYLLVL